MPIISTLSGRSKFSYRGDVKNGVSLEMTSEYKISRDFFDSLITAFQCKTLPLGANMTDPIPGGLGEWVAVNSPKLNTQRLTPKHASFVAAILVHEEFIDFKKNGNRIELIFPAVR